MLMFFSKNYANLCQVCMAFINFVSGRKGGVHQAVLFIERCCLFIDGDFISDSVAFNRTIRYTRGCFVLTLSHCIDSQ